LSVGDFPSITFPIEDVRADLLERTDRKTNCSQKGDASYFSINARGSKAVDAAWTYAEPIEGRDDIKGWVAFYWEKLDQWFEEDDEVFVHPRDPYHRVDVLHSSRHVQVLLKRGTGCRLAPSATSLRDQAADSLLPPKAGRADGCVDVNTHSVEVPLQGCGFVLDRDRWRQAVRGHCVDLSRADSRVLQDRELRLFFNEHADIVVDDEKQERPVTPWS
jgi:uncharacterized protein (DUF427 family)